MYEIIFLLLWCITVLCSVLLHLSRTESISMYQYLKWGVQKKMESGSSKWCPVTGSEARGHTKTQEVPSEIREWFLLCVWLGIEVDCPEKLWSLYPCSYLKAALTWSWTTSSHLPYLSKGVGPDELQKSLPTPPILWFWDLLECPGNLAGSTDTNIFVALLGTWVEILTHIYSKSTEAYLATHIAVKYFHQTFYSPPVEFGFSSKIQEVRTS